MPNRIFSNKSFRQLKVELRQDIMNSTQSSPAMRKEIARVFQMANRRIQNIENTGLYSPALEALGKQDITRYTKFSTAMPWTELKMEYAKAVSFLRQPTSTATGVREYSNHIMSAYDLTDKEYRLMIDNLKGKLTSLSETDFVERYLMRYKDFTGEIEAEAQSLSSMMESEAVSLAAALDKDIEKSVDKVVEQVDWQHAFKLEDEAQRLQNELDKLL